MIYTLPNSNNKARVLKDSEGDEFLYSYDTPVLLNHNGKLYRLWNGWSATTGRHIKEYCGLNKKQYLELEYKWFDSKFKNKWIGFDSKFKNKWIGFDSKIKNKPEYQKMNLEKYKRLSIKWNIAITKLITAYYDSLSQGLITNSEFLILMTKIASKNLMMDGYIKQWSIKKWKPKR